MVTVAAAFFDRSQQVNRSGLHIKASVPYFVFDATDETDAINSTYAAIPSTYEGIPLNTITVERINQTVFKTIAEYETSSGGQAGGGTPDSTFAFDTTGGTEKIFASFSTLGKYPVATAADHGGAINDDGEKVSGCERVVPVFNWQETHYFRQSEIDNTFLRTLVYTTGTINEKTFRGLLPGEVLFLGATGQRDGDDSSDLWAITYKFSGSANRTNFLVGGVTVATKRGWDYMWVEFYPTVDTDTRLHKPKSVYIEQVYSECDFGDLGIGDEFVDFGDA